MISASPPHEAGNIDERIVRVSLMSALLRRPELGAVAGLALVFVFFLIFANASMFSLVGILNFMVPAAQLGILAIGAALLMIGGEFDLSLGSAVAFTGFVFAAALVVWQLPVAVALLAAFAVALAIGFANAQIVLRTGLPSFIVTLAFLFILRGATLVGLKWASGGATQLRGVKDLVRDSAVAGFFTGNVGHGLFRWLADRGVVESLPNGLPKVDGIPVVVVWFFALTVLATWVLVRTRFGNWIFAVGGDPRAARNSGVPVERVKTILFIGTACCATLVAVLTVLDAGSTDARRGFQKEFEAIIAAVIGGCLLTGGYGSAIGASFGSIIFGIVLIGLNYTNIDQDWYLVFLGGMLLTAVVFNNMIRKRVTGER